MKDKDFIYRLPPNTLPDDLAGVGDSASGGQYGSMTEDKVKGIIAIAQRTQTERMAMAAGSFQSQNFVTGVSGWQLTPYSAEFQTATFNIGGTTITIKDTEDIQTNIDIIEVVYYTYKTVHIF